MIKKTRERSPTATIYLITTGRITLLGTLRAVRITDQVLGSVRTPGGSVIGGEPDLRVRHQNKSGPVRADSAHSGTVDGLAVAEGATCCFIGIVIIGTAKRLSGFHRPTLKRALTIFWIICGLPWLRSGLSFLLGCGQPADFHQPPFSGLPPVGSPSFATIWRSSSGGIRS